VSKSLKKARLGMLYDNENESCNAQFVQNNTALKGMSNSIPN
jgi:hypothetical protein